MIPSHSVARLRRRHFLLLGTAAILTAAAPAMALTPVQDTPGARFMTASQLLVNHRLNPSVGDRIATFAAAAHPDLDATLDAIIAAAAARDTTVVEEFFDDLPEGPVRDTAYWIIAAWYTGSSSGDRGATLFTYEEALMYQPTIDMVPIPTFGFSGPNMWGNDLYPLTALPRF